jgi:hypothetical protein
MGRGTRDQEPPSKKQWPDTTMGDALMEELRRVASGETRPVINFDNGTMDVTLPDGTPKTYPVVGQRIDEDRHRRMRELKDLGLLHEEPLRWYPASYRLSGAGQNLLDQS